MLYPRMDRDKLRLDFLGRVEKSPEPDGCWLWKGSTDGGYGLFWRGGERYAHRWSYRLFKGFIPRGRLVRHRCDVKTCVNPEHLVLGSIADNAKDRLERGGYKQGSARRSGVTEDKVLKLRVQYHAKEIKLREVSEALGMCTSQCCDIMWGRLWRHVPMPPGVRRKARRRKLKRDRRKEK